MLSLIAAPLCAHRGDVIEPIGGQFRFDGHARRGLAHLKRRSKQCIDILRGRPGRVGQTHHGAANASLDLHPEHALQSLCLARGHIARRGRWLGALLFMRPPAVDAMRRRRRWREPVEVLNLLLRRLLLHQRMSMQLLYPIEPLPGAPPA